MKYRIRRIGLIFALICLLAGCSAALWFGLRYLSDQGEGREFVPGLHEPFSSTANNTVFDWTTDEHELLVVFYFSTQCSHCVEYADEQAKAWEIVKASDDGLRIQFVAVNAALESDRAVNDFAKAHGLTFPVLAGADEQMLSAAGLRGVPTTVFYYRDRGGEWENMGTQPGGADGDKMAEAFLKIIAAAFVPGLHDPRTGAEGDDARDFVGADVDFLYIVYFNTEDLLCNQYIPDVLLAWEAVQYGDTHEWRDRMAFVLISVGQETDEAVLEFAERYQIPPGIPVLAGAGEAETGMFDDIEVAPGAQMQFNSIPATYLLYELRGGWITFGVHEGLVSVDALYGNAVGFYDWLDEMGE